MADDFGYEVALTTKCKTMTPVKLHIDTCHEKHLLATAMSFI